jgi:hypothetical protein
VTLKRLVLTFRAEGQLLVHTLYQSEELGPNLNTKAGTGHVVEMTRRGSQAACKTLEGGAEVVGTWGFTQREDVLLATTSPNAQKLVKGACKSWP